MIWIRAWISPRAGADVKGNFSAVIHIVISHFTASICTVMLTSKNCTRAVALQTMVIRRMLYRGTATARIPGRPGIRIITAVTNNMHHFILEQHKYTSV
jgi:hypothetical protein